MPKPNFTPVNDLTFYTARGLKFLTKRTGIKKKENGVIGRTKKNPKRKRKKNN
jgi:hypothetical protein